MPFSSANVKAFLESLDPTLPLLFAHATDFCGSAPKAKAKSQLALSLLSILFAVEKQLGIYRKRIEELFGLIPITTSSALYRVLASSWPHGYFPRSAMTEIALAVSPKPCSAWPELPR